MSQLLRDNGQQNVIVIDEETQTLMWVVFTMGIIAIIICIYKRWNRTVIHKAMLVQNVDPTILIYSLNGECIVLNEP